MITNQPKMIKKETIFGQPKRILKTAFFISLLSLILFPIFSQAITVECPQDNPRCYVFQVTRKGDNVGGKTKAFFPGLVPCGVRVCIGENWVNGVCPSGVIQVHHCTLCHLFIMFFAVISFIFVELVPFLAVVILALAGGTIALAGGNPELAKKGKSIIKGVVIGLVLIYGAFIITSAFFSLLGVIQWRGFGGNLFSVQDCCPIRIDERMIETVKPQPAN